MSKMQKKLKMNKAEKIHSLICIFNAINLNGLKNFTQALYVFGMKSIEYHYRKNLTNEEISNIFKISN